MKTLVIVLPLPSVGCAQNRHCHYQERRVHTKHDRTFAFRAAQALNLRGEWSAHGPISLTIEVNTVTWLAHYRASGMKPKDAVERARVKRKQTFSTYAPLDVQNAIGATKAFVDGLVDADLLADDSSHVLVEVTGRIVGDPTREPGVTMTLRRLGDAS